MNKYKCLSHLLVIYETNSSWLAPWCSFEWNQVLIGKYIAWKVKRKYARLKLNMENKKMIEDLIKLGYFFDE